jgi:hypothetical protein
LFPILSSLERFNHVLHFWQQAKDPAITTPGDKMKSLYNGDDSLTPTSGMKRTLFSQSLKGNPLLNPESGRLVEYKFSPQHLENITAQQFGGIIEHNLVQMEREHIR